MARRLESRKSATRSFPTWYKRTVFRSRTEARWALFFDLMRITWEYETEGFDLDAGGYLPDFWLPGWETWAEVKPAFGVRNPERAKAEGLVRLTRNPLVFLSGAPWPKSYETLVYEPMYPGPQPFLWPMCFTNDGIKRKRLWHEPEESRIPSRGVVAAAMAVARAAEFTEPPAESYLPIDAVGMSVVDGEEWETGAPLKQESGDRSA